MVLILPLPGRSVPCDVRNISLSGHKCLLRRTQIFRVGRGNLPATPLTSGNAANAGSRSKSLWPPTPPWQQRYDVGIKHEQYVLAELGKRG